MVNNSQRQSFVQAQQHLQSPYVIHLASHQPLENAQEAIHLATFGNDVAAAQQERLPDTNQSGDVAALFPEAGSEEGLEEPLVRVGQAGVDRVQLEQLSEDLEDVGDKFCLVQLLVPRISCEFSSPATS